MNTQQLQGVTSKDPSTWLLCDLPNCYWLQGAGGVQVTRSDDMERVVVKPPEAGAEWTRHRNNWFYVQQRVLDWLNTCRASGYASGNPGCSPEERQSAVLAAVEGLKPRRLCDLMAVQQVLRAEHAAFRAQGGWQATAYGGGG